MNKPQSYCNCVLLDMNQVEMGQVKFLIRLFSFLITETQILELVVDDCCLSSCCCVYISQYSQINDGHLEK